MRIDPELKRQLDEVGASDAPIQAVVYLESGEKMTPEEVAAAAQRIIDSAALKVTRGPNRVNVMRNLGVVAVEAPASFVRSLIGQPGVGSAIANIQPALEGASAVSAAVDRPADDAGTDAVSTHAETADDITVDAQAGPD